MTIASKKEIVLENTKRNRNAMPIYCIDTGAIYASLTDAAMETGVTVPTMSVAVKHGGKCKGKRFCKVADLAMNLPKIAETTKRLNKACNAYNTLLADYNKAKEAERRENERRERIANYKAKIAELEQAIEYENNN